MASFKLKEPPPRVIEGVEVPLDSTGRPLTAKAFNKPDSGLYFYNDRLQRIHVRRWLPASVAEAKGIVFQFHGYADHCNNSNKEELAAALTSAGFAVFMFDAHGHGYSEGDRVYVAKWQHLIDDAILFVNLILAGAVTGHRDVKFDVDVIVWGEFLKSAPFAFMGQSLGGAVTVLSSTIIYSEGSPLSERFMGAVLMCPAVRAVLPPAPVVYFFRYVLAPLCPKALVPAMFEKSQKPENLFTSKENTMKFYLDHWGREGGLSWGKSIRIGTADQLLTMCSLVEKSLPKITFPFLVIHDPEDQVVEFAGTQLLLEKSATPTDIYRGRELHEMLGEKHDLMSNCGDKTFAIICDWLTDRLANCFEKTPTI